MKIIQRNENFLKKFLIGFYNKIIDTNDFCTFENTTIKWMKKELKKYDKNPENFLEMMEIHKNHQIWFTSLTGFFYQHGIGCDIDISMALELYSLNENGKEVDKLHDVNIVIGKYLLSLIYYKDIILISTSTNKVNKFENFKSNFTKDKSLKIIFDDVIDNHEDDNSDVKDIIEDNINTTKGYLKSQVNTNVKDNTEDYNQTKKELESYNKNYFENIKISAIEG